MGFAVSARHTAAGIASRQATQPQPRRPAPQLSDRRAEFAAFDQAYREEQFLEQARASMAGLRNRNHIYPIIREIAEFHGVTAEDLLCHSRKRVLANARQHAAYEVRRRRPSLSLPAIGRAFGNRDHTTILHAIRVWPQKAEKLGIPCEPMKEPT